MQDHKEIARLTSVLDEPLLWAWIAVCDTELGAIEQAAQNIRCDGSEGGFIRPLRGSPRDERAQALVVQVHDHHLRVFVQQARLQPA
jgi:hypothetical protein